VLNRPQQALPDEKSANGVMHSSRVNRPYGKIAKFAPKSR